MKPTLRYMVKLPSQWSLRRHSTAALAAAMLALLALLGLSSPSFALAGPRAKSNGDESAVPKSERIWAFTRNRVKPIKPTSKKKSARQIPDQLVIPPGRYAFQGRSYVLRREGAYRFGVGSAAVHRIVFAQRPEALIEAGSALSVATRRDSDDGLHEQFGQLERTVMKRRLRVSCGVIASFVVHLLEQQGHQARRVAVSTPEPLEGNSSSGHTFMEARIGDEWQVFDPYFAMKPLVNGRPVTLLRYVRARDKPMKFRWLAPRAYRDEGPLPYRELMGTPLIEDGWSFYYFLTRYHSIEEYTKFSNDWYQWISRDQFKARFYG